MNLVREVDFEKYNIIKPMDLSDKVNGAVMLRELEELLENLSFTLLHREDEKNAPAVSLIVQRAKSLAQEFYPTGITLDEIAQRIGYGNPKYFSYIFREVTGTLPIEYRKLHR